MSDRPAMDYLLDSVKYMARWYIQQARQHDQAGEDAEKEEAIQRAEHEIRFRSWR